MAGSERDPPVRLTADEFTERFTAGARVLWTLAAGLLGDATEAEDVCQEAFVAAFAKRDQFDPRTDFQAWMGRFVRNVAANELRKRARRRTASTDPVELDGRELQLERASVALTRSRGGGPLDAPLDQEQFDERLLAGLRELGEVPRSCLLLRTLLELDYAAIAGLLAIPEGTAMSHVHRARLALREKLARDPQQVPGARGYGVQP